MLALVFSIGAVNSFAADKDKDKKAKEEKMMKCAPGKTCSKKCKDDKVKEEKKADAKKA